MDEFQGTNRFFFVWFVKMREWSKKDSLKHTIRFMHEVFSKHTPISRITILISILYETKQAKKKVPWGIKKEKKNH